MPSLLRILSLSSSHALATWIMSIPDTTYTTNGAGVLFVAIPGFSEKKVTLTATVGGDTYKFIRSGVTFANGQYYEINVKMTKQ